MSEAAQLTLTDPTEAPKYADGPISRWSKNNLVEARDEVFVRLTLRMIVVMSLAMGSLWAVLHYTPVPAWVAMAAYVAVWGYFAPPVILMLHCTMHRPFIKTSKFLTRAHPYAMSFFFGMPTGYAEHHLGMHHAEDNMQSDLSSTIRYRRDSFLNFLVYFFRFFFLIMIEITAYFLSHNKQKLAKRAVVSELCHDLVIAGAIALDWRFGVAAFLAPYVICRFMMMAGNWGQHAFINTGHKNNGIANAITCINAGYNARCFNDGYHIGHHLKANRHWTELPADFLANRERYAQEGAIVFQKLDFFVVSLLLWTKQYKVLAKNYVRLGAPMTDEEVIAMLKSRVEPVRVWEAERIGVTEEAAA